MWNRLFVKLRWRLTRNYTFIFGMVILSVVAVAYTIIWRNLLQHERQLLISTIYHEAEEYVHSRELPVSGDKLQSGAMLAYMVAPDGQTVILDQLTDVPAGRALLERQTAWPQQAETTRLLRLTGENGGSGRYLAGLAPVMNGDRLTGYLYMFKNMDFYYNAFFHTLYLLLCAALALLAAACVFGYWLAGREIKPLQKMYAQQKQFTADASHEMRTPLAVMRLAVSGLQNDEDSVQSDFTKETLQMLSDEVQRLTRLTESLMELARQDNSGLRPDHREVDLSRLTQKVAEQLQFLADSREIRLRTKIAPNISLSGDVNELTRLLIILLDNALKYSPAHTDVTVALSRTEKHVCLSVADQGIGISDEDKTKIFDRFYHVDKSRTASRGGLGLGLSLAQGIALRHGGSITAADNPPRGTVMRVLLPK